MIHFQIGKRKISTLKDAVVAWYAWQNGNLEGHNPPTVSAPLRARLRKRQRDGLNSTISADTLDRLIRLCPKADGDMDGDEPATKPEPVAPVEAPAKFHFMLGKEVETDLLQAVSAWLQWACNPTVGVPEISQSLRATMRARRLEREQAGANVIDLDHMEHMLSLCSVTGETGFDHATTEGLRHAALLAKTATEVDYETCATNVPYALFDGGRPCEPERPAGIGWRLVSAVGTNPGVVWYWERRVPS